MWGRSGIRNNSLNRKPDSIKINVSLRKIKEREDEVGDRYKKNYDLTPRTSLRFTSNYIKSTVKNLNKEMTNIFDPPKIPKPAKCKLQLTSDGNEKVIPIGSCNIGEAKINLENTSKINKKSSENKSETQFKSTIARRRRLRMEQKNQSADLERMFRLGLALDWNPSTSNKDKNINGTSENKSSSSSITGSFVEGLDFMKSHFSEKRSETDQYEQLKKSSMEKGWIDFGRQKNCQLPHQLMYPFEGKVEDKIGKIDGLVTLEELMEYAKEKVQSPYTSLVKRNVRKSREKRGNLVNKTHPDQSSSIRENNLQMQEESKENKTPRFSTKSDSSEKSQAWMEKANRWASNNNENLKGLTEEEKLTNAWRESLARWEAEKRDLLAEASKNHYYLGERTFQSSFNSSESFKNYYDNQKRASKIDNLASSFSPSNQNICPYKMNPRDIKTFCFYWDQATESNRLTLMTKFLKLYSGLEAPLDVEEAFSGGAGLLFMRFAFGFKVAFIKKQRCWRYVECLLILLQSHENNAFVKQLLEINILEDLLELVRYDESYLFDKLQSLYFLNKLLEGPDGQEVIRAISCSGKLMDLLLQFCMSCEDPQTLLICRSILINIIERTDATTSEIILEAISHVILNNKTPLKIEVIFQVIQCILDRHPSIIIKCGPLILKNLNTTDINIMLGIGELTATISVLEHPKCFEVIKALFDKALKPFTNEVYRKYNRQTENSWVWEHNNSQSDEDLCKESCLHYSFENDSDGHLNSQQTEQFTALFVINYVLKESKISSEILAECGGLGLSLIATGQRFSKKIQREGIRLICCLHEVNFECAASYTLLLSDEILSNILTRGFDCLDEVSADALYHIRQLGYLILENYDSWIKEVIIPTKCELKEDFEAAMSKDEDYTVDLNCTATTSQNECQKILRNALNSPLGQQAAEILKKLKTSWMKNDDDAYANVKSSSTIKEIEDKDGLSHSDSESNSSDDWITYETGHSVTESQSKKPYSPTTVKDSYIEEIDTDCSSISYSYACSNAVDATSGEESEEGEGTSENLSEYHSHEINFTRADQKCFDNSSPGQSQDTAYLENMRKIIEKYQ